MGNKLTLDDVANLQNESSVVTTLAQNNRAIEAAIENTLSRDGTAPNFMQNNLDANSNRILNLPAPLSGSEPLRVADVDVNGDFNVSTMPTGGTSGQVLTKDTVADFDVSWQTPIPPIAPATNAPIMDSSAAVGVSVKYAREDHVHPSDTTKAPLASPTFTGTVTTPSLKVTGISANQTVQTNASNDIVSTSNTGTGSVVMSNSPTLVTPALGTPSALTLTNATGLPVTTGISGLGTGISAFLGTPSSANLRTALTDETGTGSAVFATAPTLSTPILTGSTAPTTAGALGFGAFINYGDGSSNHALCNVDSAQTLTNKTLTTPIITGITSGSSPASGVIGETITNFSTGVSVLSNTAKTITSFTIPAGFFILFGHITVNPNGSNTLTEIHVSFSDTNNTLSGFPLGAPHAMHVAFQDAQAQIIPTGIAIWNFNSSHTAYLVTNLKYTTGSTMTVDGYISAIRIA